MITVIRSVNRFEDKLKSVLDTMELRNTDHSTILLQKKEYMDTFDWMLKHPKIKRIKVAGDTIFVIKNKRVELKSIDYFI